MSASPFRPVLPPMASTVVTDVMRTHHFAEGDDSWLTSAEPGAYITDITPEMAMRWLGYNRKNRNKKLVRIARMKRDMVADAWLLTGEAPKFDRFGNMIDGQNRMFAIIETGVTIRSFVIVGLDPESQDVMDTNTPRTPADMLSIDGIRNAPKVTAAASAYEAWTTGFYKHAMWQSNPKYTNAELKEIVDRTPDIMTSSSATLHLRTQLALTHGAVAAAHLRFSRIDADATQEFFDRLAENQTNGKGDPLNLLLKRAADLRSNQQRVWPPTALFYLTRTWNAYRTNSQLSRFLIGAEGRWAPIPEPV